MSNNNSNMLYSLINQPNNAHLPLFTSLIPQYSGCKSHPPTDILLSPATKSLSLQLFRSPFSPKLYTTTSSIFVASIYGRRRRSSSIISSSIKTAWCRCRLSCVGRDNNFSLLLSSC